MARFSFNGNPAMTDAEFEKMISTDKGLRMAKYATGYCDKSLNVKGYHVEWPTYEDSHDLTDEQREAANIRFEQRKGEVLDTLKRGVLLIVTMGADYKSDGIGNHRVRVCFRDNQGDTIGVEFMPFKGGFSWDRWNSSEEKRKSDAFISKLEELEKVYGKRIPLNLRPEFPSTYADRGTSELPYTCDGVIRWLKDNHNVVFSSAHIDRYFFACDEVVSIPL